MCGNLIYGFLWFFIRKLLELIAAEVSEKFYNHLLKGSPVNAPATNLLAVTRRDVAGSTTATEVRREVDLELQEECEGVLRDDTYSCHLRPIEVTAYTDGHIVLTGAVDRYFKKQVAVPAFRFTESVKSIDNQVEVVQKTLS